MPEDLIGGTASCGIALVHDGSVAVGCPHSSASQPPSPSGKALATPCELVSKSFYIDHLRRAFPEGEGGPGVSPGRMRATS